MKHIINSLIVITLMLSIGCVSSRPGGAKLDSLYSQVKAEDQVAVQQLKQDLLIAEHNEELAKLERKRDDMQRERSRLNAKRTELQSIEQQYRIAIAKLKAIDKNKLGDHIDNIESTTDAQVELLEILQKQLKYASEVDVLDVRIKKVEQSIVEHHNKMSGKMSEELYRLRDMLEEGDALTQL